MNIICDSSFWIALYDKKNQNHHIAIKYLEKIETSNATIFIPWPSLYILLDTRFSKKELWQLDLFRRMKKTNYHIISDTDYDKNFLLEQLFESKEFSLVDGIIHQILNDTQKQIDYIISFHKTNTILSKLFSL